MGLRKTGPEARTSTRQVIYTASHSNAREDGKSQNPVSPRRLPVSVAFFRGKVEFLPI
jgi:hypothetical protein